MKILTIGKILNGYKDFLTDFEIEGIRKVQQRQTKFSKQVKNLHLVLFSEEFDFMGDSSVDLADRSKGINPMSQEHIDRVAKKREAFGVSPLSSNGYSKDKTSYLFCEEAVRHTKNYREFFELKDRNAKQIVFVDMDNVLVNFQSGIDKISSEDKEEYGPEHYDNVPGIFSLMEPNEGAIEAYEWLSQKFDTYILSTAPWENPSAWTDKLLWVKRHLPEVAWKRLILSHHKNLLKGDYIIDDRDARGVDQFSGKHIHFAKEGAGFDDWKAVISYLKHLA